jgi:tRNA (guanine6-N2)-methyltransferase
MPKNSVSDSSLFVAEVAPGLEDVASAEISALSGTDILAAEKNSSEVEFTYAGKPGDLLRLKTVIAINSVRRYNVPRPKAFLGHQHLQTLLRQIQQALHLHPAGTFTTFYISAAGSDSSVMQRIKEEVAKELGLQSAAHEGDVLLRIRRDPQKRGWETLVRLSPRPLATRAWRVQDLPGALNASVAQAMVRLTLPEATDRCLNIVCGSGTILIERRLHAPAVQMLGCDLAETSLEAARANIEAAGYADDIRLIQANAARLPLPNAAFNALFADLPFGNLSGSHAENERLYPALLAEAARVSQPGARFVILTHEVRLMETVIRHSSHWTQRHIRMVTLGGLHPRIFLLVRQ